MRWLRTARPIVILAVTGVLTGSLAGFLTFPIVPSAVAQDGSGPRGVLDVTHLPPLLTLPGESPELVYDAHCAAAGTEDAEAPCRVDGTVFARPAGTEAFRQFPLDTRGTQLVTTLPSALARRTGSVEYYAAFTSPDAGASITVPSGGASAPSASRTLDGAALVALGRHPFGTSRHTGDRVAFARWGNGPSEVGLEEGRGLDPVGASAFDVDAAGSVFVLDHAHRRLLRWDEGARVPTRVALSTNGAIADLAVAGDGSFYVLETTSRDERRPLIRRFDDDGRELEAIETAERSPSQVRIGPAGPLVLHRPSHQWMPAFVSGVPAPPSVQRRRGRMGRSLRSGGEIVVFRHESELRIAIVSGDTVARAWRITSDTSLGEVQLAEPQGSRLAVVVRVYNDRTDEFAVLLLDRQGLVSRRTLDSAEWAEGAPLGRFRLVGRSIYRLGTSSEGAFVDRFTLEMGR